MRARVADYFPQYTIRRSSQAERAYEADLIIEGPDCPAWLSALWFECEHANQVDAMKKLEQGERDALEFYERMKRDRYVVACTRETGRRVINATLRLGTLLVVIGDRKPLAETVGWNQVVTLPLEDLLAQLVSRAC